jgi:DHA2 family multidrug resistance protein
MAFAIYGMAVVLAPTIGPTLGGYITDNTSWRWIFYINVPIGVLSLYLSNRMVEDPPHLVKAREETKRQRVDFVGLAMIGLALGSFQVVVDTGERNDWFASTHIVILSIVAVSLLVLFVFWELRQMHPVINLRLFANRNFAVAAALMLALGVALYGSVVLIPQFLQLLMGYTAQLAGEVLSLGGFAIILLMPIVGLLVSRVDARYLIAFGFIVSGLSLLALTQINLLIDFRTAMIWRVYQAVGLAFLFVPINTISYVGIRPEQNNQVSGIMNLMRNMGGSIGISTVTTLLARQSQTHQHDLVAHLYGSNPVLTNRIATLAGYLHSRGASGYAATRGAYGRIYGAVQQQAAVLAYVDTFWILAIVCFAIVPIVFIASRPKPGQAAMGH